jgi:LssY C-terminus
MANEQELPPPTKTRGRRKKIVSLVIGLVLVWAVAAYLLAPAMWKRYTRKHPSLEDVPGVTFTADGIPADPINIALIGTKAEVLKIMLAAKWYPADPLTFRSSLEIAEASVLKREYEDAPVSSEFLFDRKQDLAFEQAVGDNPRHRHHVRFWESDKRDPDGRPVWLGAAIFDKRVGLSRTTGQITHLTAPDVDTERDKLFDDLKQTGDLAEFIIVPGFHKVREGRNGEGVSWHTDGNLYEGVIAPGTSKLP